MEIVMKKRIESLNKSFEKNRIDEKKLEKLAGGNCPTLCGTYCFSLSCTDLLNPCPLYKWIYGANCT